MQRCTLIYPISGKGYVLLARKKRKVGAGLLNGWGGKEEPEDHGNMKKCACREFAKETGVPIFPQHLREMTVVNFFEAGVLIYECHVYFLSWWEGKIRETEEMGPPLEFAVDRVPYTEMMPADGQWLKKLMEGRRYRSINVYYSEGNTEVLRIVYDPF